MPDRFSPYHARRLKPTAIHNPARRAGLELFQPLYLDIYLLLIKHIPRNPVEQHKEDGPCQGTAVIAEKGHKNIAVNISLDAAEECRNDGSLHVEVQGVDAEGLEEHRPAFFLVDVDNPYQDGEQEGAESAGRQYEGAAPDFLVYRTAITEQQTGKEEEGTEDENAADD